MNWKAFLQGIFMDNGAPSFSRIGSAIALGFSCGWITSIVCKTHVLPDFAGVCMFIGTLYGTNVIGNAAPKLFNRDHQGEDHQ